MKFTSPRGEGPLLLLDNELLVLSPDGTNFLVGTSINSLFDTHPPPRHKISQILRLPNLLISQPDKASYTTLTFVTRGRFHPRRPRVSDFERCHTCPIPAKTEAVSCRGLP